MNDIIDAKLCTNCGVRPVKPPKRQYCSDECAVVAHRMQQANHMQNKRTPSLVDKSVDNSLTIEKHYTPDQIGNVTLPEKTAIIPNSSDSIDQFAVVFQDVLEHFSFSFNQQLLGMKAEIVESQNALAIKFDEMEFTMKQHPEYNKRLGEWTRKVAQAIQVYKMFGKRYPLNKIRQYLEQLLQIDKQTAETILKQAIQRVEFDKDPDQSDLSEFS